MVESLTLYLMRHGETEDNVSNTITAQADSALTPRGHAQALEKGTIMKHLIKKQDTLTFMASPLHRACVTMELARTAAGLPARGYQTDARLMEMSFGDWTKRTEGDDRYEAGLPSAHEQWGLRPPNGESQEMVYARVGRFLNGLSGDSVISCHARVICMLRGHILGLSPEEIMRYQPSNAGILKLSKAEEVWL